MSGHLGSRACYQKGCRELECRLANAVYQSRYRTKVRMAEQPGGAIVDGYRTSRQLQKMRSEGYRPTVLARLLGVSRDTCWRHLHSCPAIVRTFVRVKHFSEQMEEGAETRLDPARSRIVESMLNSLGWDRTTHAQAWQDVQPSDEE